MKLPVLTALAVLLASPVASQYSFYELHTRFSTPKHQRPHVAPGYGARHYKTLQECLTRRRTLLAYLRGTVTDPKVRYTAFCVEIIVRGYGAAIDSFHRKIGEEM